MKKALTKAKEKDVNIVYDIVNNLLQTSLHCTSAKITTAVFAINIVLLTFRSRLPSFFVDKS